MGKKHKKNQAGPAGSAHVALSHAQEYRVIKGDLVRVAGLNVLYLALVLALFFTNARSGYLERWFEQVLHF
jgi:hypothetical protein